MKKTLFILLILSVFALNSCSVSYNLTGAGKIDAKTFQVNNFINNAPLVEPGIERVFTQRLQNYIQNQTNLNLTNSNGDLRYEGEITDYNIAPMASIAGDKAAQNRLNIAINVRFSNTKKESDNFEKRFTFYYDYPANSQLVGSTLSDALTEIFDRITQDIFNDSLAKW